MSNERDNQLEQSATEILAPSMNLGQLPEETVKLVAIFVGLDGDCLEGFR